MPHAPLAKAQFAHEALVSFIPQSSLDHPLDHLSIIHSSFIRPFIHFYHSLGRILE
jgi:hypothetical protein